MKTRVAVMYGGKSVEHEVSVISGIQALHSLDMGKYDAIPVYITKQGEMYLGDDIGDMDAYKDIGKLLARSQRVILVSDAGRVYLQPYPMKRFGAAKPVEIDVVLPVVHGTNVEDGKLQGYLGTIGVPYAGCDVTASAIGMDKYLMKAVLKDHGIPVLDSLCFSTADYAQVEQIVTKIEAQLGYPVIVKPANLGSSVGISVAKDRTELLRALDDAFLYAKRVLVEHAITQLREINCSVLGDIDAAEASECEEPLHSEEILSYKDKYEGGGKNGSKGMASVTRKIPADISSSRREEIRSMAVRAFQAMNCSGVARMDFMIDGENDQLYFNEINTIPGSLAFYLWEPVGVSYPVLLDRLIQLALKRAREESGITYTFDTNILSHNALSGAKGSKR